MYIGSLANMLGNIRSGITTTTDTAEGSYTIPGALASVYRAADEAGIRAILSFETTGRISQENQELGLRENIDFHYCPIINLVIAIVYKNHPPGICNQNL